MVVKDGVHCVDGLTNNRRLSSPTDISARHCTVPADRSQQTYLDSVRSPAAVAGRSSTPSRRHSRHSADWSTTPCRLHALSSWAPRDPPRPCMLSHEPTKCEHLSISCFRPVALVHFINDYSTFFHYFSFAVSFLYLLATRRSMKHSPLRSLIAQLWVWVCRFLTAHQHIKGHLVSYDS